jgi:hypothetical protein
MIKIANLLNECGDCDRQGTDYTHGHDHEASMADGELRDMISNASKLQNMIQPGDELPGWVSAYITLAADYMHSVAEYMAEQQAEIGSIQQSTPGYAVYEDKKKKDKNWIQKAVDPKHKGELHKALHVGQDKDIPKSKLNKATHSKDPHVRHMAQFAKNVQKK